MKTRLRRSFASPMPGLVRPEYVLAGLIITRPALFSSGIAILAAPLLKVVSVLCT